jgi:CheY-like chemotaxis protein
VLLDLILPKIDGFEVCKRLKANPQTKDIPVLIITATGEKGANHKAFSLGAADFLSKPYESSELVAKIKRLLA